MELNPLKWSWNEWKAVGRHAVSAAGGAVTVAVTFNFITPDVAHQLTDAVSNISSEVAKIAASVAAIVAAIAPIYGMLMAKRSAEPANQARSVAADLRKNGASTIPEEARKDIIGAVAKMPEVQGVVVTTPELATAIPERNVVASPADVPK